MKITDLIISPESLGKRFWLTTVTKIVEYKDNKPTENILGYRYIVALPDRNLDKIAIRIDGTQKMEQPQTGFVEVNFQNLEIFIFWMQGKPEVGARATNVILANQKS